MYYYTFMDTVQIRRARLKHWIDTRFNGRQADFIAAANERINQGEVSNLLKDKSFGEKRARRLEQQANMPEGYLDTPIDKDAAVGDAVGSFSQDDAIPAGYTAILEYDIDFSCGDSADGELTYEQIQGGTVVVYKDDWFEQQGVRKAAVKRFRCSGQSMFPIIRNRWRFAVNLDQKDLPKLTTGEADVLRKNVELPIYSIVDDTVRKTKFVYINTDTDEVVIESYNPDFKTERRDMEYAQNYIQVIGKVIDISGDPNK